MDKEAKLVKTFCFSELNSRYCYNCLDIAVLESDRQPDNPAKPLYEAVVDVKFDGIYPPSCEHPSYVKCSEEKTCYSFESEISGICKFFLAQCSIKAAPWDDINFRF